MLPTRARRADEGRPGRAVFRHSRGLDAPFLPSNLLRVVPLSSLRIGCQPARGHTLLRDYLWARHSICGIVKQRVIKNKSPIEHTSGQSNVHACTAWKSFFYNHGDGAVASSVVILVVHQTRVCSCRPADTARLPPIHQRGKLHERAQDLGTTRLKRHAGAIQHAISM